MGTQGVGTFLINSKFASGSLVFYEKAVGLTTTGNVFTVGTAAVKVGDTGNDIDFQYYGTGSLSAIIDCGAATLTLVGITATTNKPLSITDTTASTTTATGALKVSGGVGIAKGLFIGERLGLATSGTPYTFTEGTPAVAIYTTNASVHASTSAESFLVSNTQTGIAGVGGRARFYMTTNVAMGGWANALKAQTVFGTSGRVTGLGSAFCAEMTLSAGTTSGTYAPLESELVADSAVSSGAATSFLYADIGGSNSTGKTTLNTNGYLFELGAGVVDTTNGLLDVATITPTSVEFDARLRIRIGGVDYFIPLGADAAFE